MPKKKYPVLLAYDVPVGKTATVPTWKAWCPHCRGWHYHSPSPGHRVAHCYDGVNAKGAHDENHPFHDGYELLHHTKAKD